MLSTGTAASKISILLVFVITTREQLHQRLGVLVDQLSELWVVGRELLDDRLEVRWVLLDELVEEEEKGFRRVSGRAIGDVVLHSGKSSNLANLLHAWHLFETCRHTACTSTGSSTGRRSRSGRSTATSLSVHWQTTTRGQLNHPGLFSDKAEWKTYWQQRQPSMTREPM
jgi:hypothetical protein